MEAIEYAQRTLCRMAQTLHMLAQSLWLHTCFDLLIRMSVFPWCPTFPVAFTLSTSSYEDFPELWGERFDGGIQLRVECSRVFQSLYNDWLWVSVFILICCRGGASLMLAEQALLYEDGRMSLGVVLLLLFSSSIIVVFGFTLRLSAI